MSFILTLAVIRTHLEVMKQVTGWQIMYVLIVWSVKATLQLIKNGWMPVGTRKVLTYQIHS